MCMGGGSGDAAALQQQQLAQQQATTNQSVAGINQAFSGFTPQFYQGVDTAYQNWATPQLQQQAQTAQNQTGFKLASQGLGNSSQAQQSYDALGQANTQAQQQIAQSGLQQSQQLQQQVGQQQANLIGQAQTATDPSAMSQSALATAGSFGAPSSFAPLGQLFNTYGNNFLGGQQAQTYNAALASLSNNPFGTNSQTSSFLPSSFQLG